MTDVRELRITDADAVAALLESANAKRHVDAEEVRSWLDHAAIDPADLRVLEEDGRVVGYVDVVVGEDLGWISILGVDAESPTGATRLYERVGMRVVARSEAWEKLPA
jgi:ribosomal protein S18 acetylase RimI-like enzyme